MKKIGFVDLYLSEWHANNYPGWIRQVCAKENLDYQICYAWAEQDVSPVDGVTSAQWCQQQNVELCETLAELCEKSDCIIVLAPSNPETHLRYAQEVLKYQKRTYIDKTFAPDAATAQKIVDLSKAYGTPFFTTSALRYASELVPLAGVDNVQVTGGGRSLEEYSIHQVEMIVKTLGTGAQKVCARKEGNVAAIEIAYCDRRQAQMYYEETAGFTCKAEKDGVALYDGGIQSDFFMVLMEKIVHFFETGEVDFRQEETMEVMRIRESVLKAADNLGTWIPLP